MKSMCGWLVLCLAAPAFALTPTFDGTLGEWTGPGVLDLGAQPAPSVNNYRLLVTWDATNLYAAMDRNATDRYLGDTAWDNDSFFIAIDYTAGGATQDGYGQMNFSGPNLPDRFYYYAGGAGWYEVSSWNGASMDWLGWTNSGSFYGYQEANPDDEVAIALSDIGGSPNVTVWAWMTREANGYVEASWPGGATGSLPTAGAGILLPEPMSALMLVLGGFALLRRR